MKKLIILTFSLLFLFSSCLVDLEPDEVESYTSIAETKITTEVITYEETEFVNEIELTTETEAEVVEEQPSEETVYWTSGGSVWHFSKECSTLQRSKTILEGTIKESKKSRSCEVCS